MHASRRPSTIAILGSIAFATSTVLASPPAAAQTAAPRTFAVYFQSFRIQADEATPDNSNGISFLTGSRLVGYAPVNRVLHVIADEATGPALPGR